MNVPEDRMYTDEHEWIQGRDDGSYRVGITDYAQDALGDVVYVDLPDLDLTCAAGDSVSEVESTKSVAEVYAPLAGTVTAVNSGLEDHPELLNSDPYGDGWMFAIDPGDTPLPGGLLDAAAYRALTE